MSLVGAGLPGTGYPEAASPAVRAAQEATWFAPIDAMTGQGFKRPDAEDAAFIKHRARCWREATVGAIEDLRVQLDRCRAERTQLEEAAAARRAEVEALGRMPGLKDPATGRYDPTATAWVIDDRHHVRLQWAAAVRAVDANTTSEQNYRTLIREMQDQLRAGPDSGVTAGSGVNVSSARRSEGSEGRPLLSPDDLPAPHGPPEAQFLMPGVLP